MWVIKSLIELVVLALSLNLNNCYLCCLIVGHECFPLHIHWAYGYTVNELKEKKVMLISFLKYRMDEKET